MENETKKLTATLKVVVTGEFHDPEGSEETLRYWIEQVLEDEGFEVDVTLLKEPEPVKPILKREGRNKFYNDYECPVCGDDICYEQKYCSECGRGMKWDDCF